MRLVVVGDPAGNEPDDFLFTTDLEIGAAEVVEIYVGRWSIEMCYRDVKQTIGGEEPQSWNDTGPQRAPALSFWLYGAVWTWYIETHGRRPAFVVRPWFPKKTNPSFDDALTQLRRALWRDRIPPASGTPALDQQTVEVLLDASAMAA